jgi:hypothetical protein
MVIDKTLDQPSKALGRGINNDIDVESRPRLAVI